MRTRIKVCGITRPEDARVAVEAGADALGFVFAESPRRVTPEQAAAIIRELPPFIATVGVFVDHDLPTVLHIAEGAGLTAVQLHGAETIAELRELRRRSRARVIRAFRVRDAAFLGELDEYRDWCDAFLLDAFVPGAAGGTGKTFDWDLAIAARDCGRPLMLAGGLNPGNVAAAVRRVQPYALDVSSGVEERPGVKDADRVRAFVRAVQDADAAWTLASCRAR